MAECRGRDGRVPKREMAECRGAGVAECRGRDVRVPRRVLGRCRVVVGGRWVGRWEERVVESPARHPRVVHGGCLLTCDADLGTGREELLHAARVSEAARDVQGRHARELQGV